MRRFIFIFMIVLVPLRGWMGEAMATELVAINLIATKTINTPDSIDFPAEKNMSDCDMHKTNASDTTLHSDAKPSCTHCQACHATGLASAVQITSIDQVQHAQPLAQNSQFASASIAHSQKPPIL